MTLVYKKESLTEVEEIADRGKSTLYRLHPHVVCKFWVEFTQQGAIAHITCQIIASVIPSLIQLKLIQWNPSMRTP